MTGPLGSVLVGCMATMVFGISTAKAAGGRIVFSGAIVEPTCSVDSARLNSVSSAVAKPLYLSCGARDTAADTGRVYALTQISLAAASADHDQLITYFAGYLGPEGAAEARVVTQTFE